MSAKAEAELSKRAYKRTTQALAVAIVALLLGFFATPFSLVYGSNERDNANSIATELEVVQGNISAQQLQLAALQSELAEVLMNVSAADFINTTLVSQGTFQWRILNQVTPGRSNYRIENVQIGPLNFQTLTLDGPVGATGMNSGGSNNYVKLENFVPPLNEVAYLPVFNTGAQAYIIPLTSNNIKKFLINGNHACFNDGTIDSPDCGVRGRTGDFVRVFRNTIVFACTFNSCSTPALDYFEFYVYLNGATPGGAVLTFESPLQLILPAR